MFYCRLWLGAARSHLLLLPQEKTCIVERDSHLPCFILSLLEFDSVNMSFLPYPTLISHLFAEEQLGVILIFGLSLSALTSNSETEEQETRETYAPLFLVEDLDSLFTPLDLSVISSCSFLFSPVMIQQQRW